MAVRPILKMGDARLLRVARPVQAFASPALAELVQDLVDTMHDANGAGIAAPQIGVDLQVVIFGGDAVNPRYPDRPLVPRTVLCNPQITPLSTEEEDGWEDDDEPAPVPKKEMLDLSSASVDGDTGGDELLLDADRLAEEDEPVQGGAAPRRKGLVSGGSGGSGGTSGGAGSTLFERMANLSRGSSSDDDEEDDDGGDGASSVSIPRFLGRQNNQ